MIIMFVFGAYAFVWATVSTTVRQRAVPQGQLQGRVGSVYLIGLFGGLVVGQITGGLIAQRWGVVAPFWFAFAGSGLTLLVVWRRLGERSPTTHSGGAGSQAAIGLPPAVPVNDRFRRRPMAVVDVGAARPVGARPARRATWSSSTSRSTGRAILRAWAANRAGRGPPDSRLRRSMAARASRIRAAARCRRRPRAERPPEGMDLAC